MANLEMPHGSVSGWISKMREGDADAICKLVSRYFGKLAQFAEAKVRRGIRIIDDGEDIALSVLQTIIRNSAKGKLPKLQDRDDLWFLMIVIAQHIVIDRKRIAIKQEQRTAPIHTMTDLLETYNVNLEEFLTQDDSQERLMEIVDCWEELLRSLADDFDRETARLKMQGHSNREIANMLGTIPKKIDRKVKKIARRWEDYFSERFYR